MNCHECGAALPSEARFCRSCGAGQQVDLSAVPSGEPLVRPAAPVGPPVDQRPDQPPAAAAPAPAGSAPPSGRRPRWLLPVAVAAVVVAVLAAVLVRPWDRDGDGGDAAVFDLLGPGRVELASGPTGKPERAWSIDQDAEAGVLQVGRDSFFFTAERDGDPALVARSLADGEEVWSEPVAAVDTAVVHGNALIVAVSTEDEEEHEVRSYDQSSGELNWSATVDERVNRLWDHGEALIAMTGARMVGLRPDDGEEVWEVPADEYNRFLVTVGGGVVFAAREQEVRAFSLRDGEERWSVALDDPVFSIALSGDRVVVPVKDEVVAVGAGDGEELWRVDPDVEGGGGVVAVDGSTVVVNGFEDATAIDSSDGSAREDFEIDEEDWRSNSQRLPTGDILVYQVERSAKVIDPSTGDVRWRGDGMVSAASESMLFVMVEGELSAYGMDDFEERWSIDLDGRPYIGDGCLLVRTDDGFELWR